MRTLAAVLTLSLSSVSVAASAAGHIKPGLWGMTVKSDAMKNMPKISAEQMEQMRKLGINIPQMTDGGMVTKVCVSKQMAERDQPPVAAQKESGCQTRNFRRGGGGYSADIVCDGPMMQGEGKVKGSFSGDESFASIYDFKGTAQGRPISQHQESSGRWLGADCGDVKPVDELMPKK